MSTAGNPWRDASTHELGAGFARGDEEALEESYRRYSALIYTVAMRALGTVAEAEDVTQQTYVGAWRSYAQFSPDAGSLPGWLVGIAKHRIADQQRGRARDLRLVSAAGRHAEVQVPAPAPAEAITDRLVLANELTMLPDPRGTILRLVYYEGRTLAQVAEQLDLPLGTVKSHARRALLQLRSRLQEVTS